MRKIECGGGQHRAISHAERDWLARDPCFVARRLQYWHAAAPLASGTCRTRATCSHRAQAVVVILFAAGMSMAQMTPGNRAPAGNGALTGCAAELYQKAQRGKWFAEAMKWNPDILPTSDGKSFLVVWKAQAKPRRWIVSLHGSEGFATDDLAIWHPHLKGRDVGIVCLQWWLGEGDRIGSYYTPEQIYREIDNALQRIGVDPGAAMLHGFSRGSANSYAVMALDAGRGRRFFRLAVASSGGVSLDYPPTQAILAGRYGKDALKGTRWITAAGARDPHPDRDGISGMRRTAAWLKEQGAVVLHAVEDPEEGHGALVRNPANARRVLDLFFEDSMK